MTAGGAVWGDVVQQVLDAWTVEGRAPDYHRGMQSRLHREWPVLAIALDRLAAAYITPEIREFPDGGPIPAELRDFPWAVENRVVREPIYALFREREDADEMVEDSLDLRVIPNPRMNRG